MTGKKITLPPLGTQANVGSLPMNEILTPDGKYAITTDMGFRQSLHAISTTTGQDAGSPLQFGHDNGDGTYGPPGLYYGLADQGQRRRQQHAVRLRRREQRHRRGERQQLGRTDPDQDHCS